MSREYFLFYAEANIVCVILIGIMLFHDLRKVSRQEKQMLFDYAVSAHIAYFISDTFWAAVLSGALPCARWLVLLLNLSNFVLLSSIAFFWFFYVAECVGVPLWRDRYTNRRRMNLIRLPLLGTIAVLVVAYLVHPDYWISPAGEVASAYYPLLIAAPVIYIIMSMICAVSQARKQSSPILRHQFILVGIYPLSVVVFGLLQLYALHIPLFCFGLTIMLFLFYIQAMESRISLDPMTGLNNRGQLMRYVSQSSNLRREGLRTYAVMADANSFKQINDTYGHAEGDRAILLIAQALKEAVGILPVPPFLGRYGGDEFILVAYAGTEDEIVALAAEIRRLLEMFCRENATPYLLSLGLGWAELTGGDDTFLDCLKRADKRLYLDKARMKRSASDQSA